MGKLSGFVALGLLIAVSFMPGNLLASETGTLTKAPAVAVASSFRALWPDLMALYTAETGQARPRASFASSGLLSTQILHGAPFEMFLSADQASVSRLRQAGKARDAGISIAQGGLSLVTRRTSNRQEMLNLNHLELALMASSTVKLAVPNPRHAPYGISAQQALTSAGLWPLSQGTLLAAENASQSLQYALSGAAAFAIVPTTLVTPAPDTLYAVDVPDTLYNAVDHRAVLLATSSTAADTFMSWLQSPSAKDVLRHFGLSVPH